MRELLDAMVHYASEDGSRTAISDQKGSLSRADLLRRVSGLAATLRLMPRVVGLLAPNGTDSVIGQIACVLGGKIVVPLPTFFSGSQLGHIVREAAIEMILATHATWSLATQGGISTYVIDERTPALQTTNFVEGFGQIIYTSGSTGRPKGVRHESGQLAWSARTLAAATGASADDKFLSVLPLPLLLETICAVLIPQLVGAQSHFEATIAEAIGRGRTAGLVDVFEQHRPTAAVLVPQLLKTWVEELSAAGHRAPFGLRFIAAGGAPMPPRLAAKARDLGIPLQEGYGLSECCSVVSLNRPGERSAGTVGRPLVGLTVTIDQGEIVVDGPSVTDGYLGQASAKRPWRTGDLGELDAAGFLTVHGRRDDMLVTSFGRNVSPEWIETMLLGDPRIALCAVLGHGAPHLTAILVPSRQAADWFNLADAKEVGQLVTECCADAPDYAVPRTVLVSSFEEVKSAQLMTNNGRFIRAALPAFVERRAQKLAAPAL
jgi:long-subunit acyl-CoA synthetase (AMP-forming)